MESIITDLYGLARYCNFGTLKRTAHSHHIAVGLQNPKISGKLQLDPNLTLEKATNLVRQRETVKQQQNILDGRFNSFFLLFFLFLFLFLFFFLADSILLQRTLMASQKENHKTSLKRNLPTAPKRKILIKSAKVLWKFAPKENTSCKVLQV